MTRDYVRSSRPAKRKPASRGGNPGRKSSTTSSAPFPMVRALLALSLVIGFGVFLYKISGSSGEAEVPVTTQTQTAAPISIEQQRPAKEQFDYMQILQNKEVPVELPDGQVIGDPSKDPQILAQQQKMQDMLRAQQDRAKLLAQQQNGQLPAEQSATSNGTTTMQPATQSVQPQQVVHTPATAVHNSSSGSTTTTANRATSTTEQTTDPRKPRSFAEVIARESGKTTSKPTTTTTTTTATAAVPKETQNATQERDEALAMFGKPQPYSANATTKAVTTAVHNNTAASTTTTTTTTNSAKRFMMQCGAFRTTDQASSLQSRIAVQGQTAQVQQANSASGSWHRVVLGPYSSRLAAEQSLARLKNAGTVQSCTIYAQ